MKNKIINKLIFMTLVFGGTMATCGCNGASSDTKKADNYYNHIDNSKETTSYLLQDSKTNYKVVVPENLSADLTYARDELKLFFKEATGVDLPVISDTNLTHSNDSYYISLGQTTLYETSELNLDTTSLKRDGYYIKTKGKSIYVVGKEDIGVLYGVYTFLEKEFHFETYTPNTHEIDENVKNVKLMNYDIMENPDIDMRTRMGYFNPVDYSKNDNIMFAYRLRRLDRLDKVLLPIHEGDPSASGHNEVHNSYFYLPKGKNSDPNANVNKHPKFYSASGQLCFTAQNDPEEFKAMYEQAGDHVIASLKYYKNNKDYSIVQFGIVDMTPMCKCESCEAVANKYNGSKAATIIIFLYEMGRYVTEWMDKPENAQYKRDLRFMFLAYSDSLQPPFAKNEDGSITVAKELKPYSNVTVMPYACFDAFDESRAFYDADNDGIRDFVDIWGSVYEGCFAWSYGTFFNDYFAFYDSYNFYADYYKSLTKNKFSLVYEQLHSNQRGADTGFHQCIGYCQAKLTWNSELDMDVLIDNYFHAVYGVAYETMKDIFQTLRVFYASVIKNIISNNGANVTSDSRIWGDNRIGFIRQLLGKFDKARQDISIFENDYETYQRLLYNIELEWLFPAKIVVDCYKEHFSKEEYNAILAKFKKLIEQMQIREHKEFTNISSYLATLSEK